MATLARRVLLFLQTFIKINLRLPTTLRHSGYNSGTLSRIKHDSSFGSINEPVRVPLYGLLYKLPQLISGSTVF